MELREVTLNDLIAGVLALAFPVLVGLLLVVI